MLVDPGKSTWVICSHLFISSFPSLSVPCVFHWLSCQHTLCGARVEIESDSLFLGLFVRSFFLLRGRVTSGRSIDRGSYHPAVAVDFLCCLGIGRRLIGGHRRESWHLGVILCTRRDSYLAARLDNDNGGAPWLSKSTNSESSSLAADF